MLTGAREAGWTGVMAIFDAPCSRRGDKDGNDRRFFEALHDSVDHTIPSGPLPVEYGHWNSLWRRFSLHQHNVRVSRRTPNEALESSFDDLDKYV